MITSSDSSLKVPQHVAIIMDGNQRWARKRGLPTIEGHRQGAERIKPVVEKALELGVKSLTFWAFSTENWKRNQAFLTDIMTIFREFLLKKNLFDELQEKGGQIHILGDISRFPADIQERLQGYLMESNPKEKKIDLNFGLNYGGRQEILKAVQEIVEKGKKGQEITEELFSSHLYTYPQPDVDLIIRTGGEIRLSGYLPWQAVYAELYFTNIFWPDYTPEDFLLALEEYSQRERRLGGDSPAAQNPS